VALAHALAQVERDICLPQEQMAALMKQLVKHDAIGQLFQRPKTQFRGK
jgi:hypothetical protein